MAQTYRVPIYGIHPPNALKSRLEERRNRLRAMRLERNRRPSEKPDDFICYDDSEDEEENQRSINQFLNTSYNFVDYIRSREFNTRESRSLNRDYGTRHILTHDMFKERPISLPNMNKVFCSQWLSDRQVVFGTKCNKLMVYDVVTERLDQIPSLKGRRDSNDPDVADQICGIHSLQINPSRTLLATGAQNSCEVAIYRLPTLDPICVGESAHGDWVFDMCWLDDQFLVSGSRDSRMALWKFDDELTELKPNVLLPSYKQVNPLVSKECKAAQKVRALAFNKPGKEIAALSLNGFIHIWNAETFKQKLSKKLPSCQENVCMTVKEEGNMYAIGCRSYTLLLDSRTLQSIKKISSRYTGCGIRSCSFQENILTIGTGIGMVMFYDLRAHKYLESSINSSRTVILKLSRGSVQAREDEIIEGLYQPKYSPAIYTHCYDHSGSRLFCAGGPLPANLDGNYAGIWQ